MNIIYIILFIKALKKEVFFNAFFIFYIKDTTIKTINIKINNSTINLQIYFNQVLYGTSK